MKERRKYARVHPGSPVRLSLKVLSEKKNMTVVKRGRTLIRNISGGGVFIEMPPVKDKVVQDLLSKKNRVELYLKIPHLRRPIKLCGKAAWMDKKVHSNRKLVGIGIQFEDMSGVERDLLLEYMLNLILQ